MNFNELCRTRYSVRKFEDRPVDRADLERVIEAGQVAPTAANRQPQRILVVEGREALERLDACTGCRFEAPLCLVVCYDEQAQWRRKYDDKGSGEIDAAIVATQMMLQAADIGLGSTWVMHFNPERLRQSQSFAIPAHYTPMALLVLGYPAADAVPHERHFDRLPSDATVSWAHF